MSADLSKIVTGHLCMHACMGAYIRTVTLHAIPFCPELWWIRLTVCLSLCLQLVLSLFRYLSLRLSVCLCLSVCLSVSLSKFYLSCLTVSLSFYMQSVSVRLSLFFCLLSIFLDYMFLCFNIYVCRIDVFLCTLMQADEGERKEEDYCKHL